MSRSVASEIQSESSSTLQRLWDLGSPEMLKSKEHPVRAALWLLVRIFSLSLLLLNPTFLGRNLPLSAPVGLLALLLPHPLAPGTMKESLLFILRTLHSSRHIGYSPLILK